jgi:hypothetical protein
MKVVFLGESGAGENHSGSNDWLVSGREYIVVEIMSDDDNGTMFRIHAGGEISPAFHKARLFRVSSRSLQGDWSANYDSEGILMLTPAPLIDADFWERYFNDDEGAKETYHQFIRMQQATY